MTNNFVFNPSLQQLSRYADVLVNFALNSGLGIKKNEVVFLQVPESAKPLLIELQKTVLRAGGHPIVQYLPDEMERLFFDEASDEQISFFPSYFLKGKVKQADHFITILAETNKHELEGIDPKKIMDRRKSLKSYIEWRNSKEAQNKFTWTLAMYPTPAMAAEAGLSINECWHQIVKACYLDDPNPVATWSRLQQENNSIRSKLNNLHIVKLHIISKDTDLTVGLGDNRQWLGGSGRNIPSFEIFISPDWRLTEGTVGFDLPLYYYGQVVKGIKLTFSRGRVVDIQAEHGLSVLKEMVSVKNADKIGEFSLTDKRFSRIDKFMAETLFDENYGGQNGNMHLALGSAYKDSYPGPANNIKKSEWRKMGYNESVIHTDIISTQPRTVTAHLKDGTAVVIYRDGRFTI